MLGGGIAGIDCVDAVRRRTRSFAYSICRIAIGIAQPRYSVAIFTDTEAIGHFGVVAASWCIGVPSVDGALVAIRTGDWRESAANRGIANVFRAIL